MGTITMYIMPVGRVSAFVNLLPDYFLARK